jgi:hypothetical protein
MTPDEVPTDKDQLLKQYELYVEMADRTSARRGETNKFYVTLLTGMLALIALAFEKNWFQHIQNEVLITAAALGFGLCILWFLNIWSYKQLNAGKYRIVHQLEKHLPFACYDCEWAELGQGKNARRYIPLSHVEICVPILLAVPYLLLLIYLIYSAANP